MTARGTPAGLRSWAGSLSPAWQAIVPGVFAWGATVARPAGTASSRLPLGFALCSLLSLALGPWLESRLPKEHGRLVAFWGFVLGALASLASGGASGPLEAPEALVGVLAWVLFAVTVAAPALGPESRGVQGLPDPSLAPRRRVPQRVWPYFALAVVGSLATFTLALAEPVRERATAFALLASAAALLVFAALGNQVRSGKREHHLRVPVLTLLVGLLLLGAACWLALSTWTKNRADASGIVQEWRSPRSSSLPSSRSDAQRSWPRSCAFTIAPTHPEPCS